MLKYVLLIVLGFLVMPELEASETDSLWVLAKDKNGIRLYTRFLEGSKFKEVKAVCTIEAELADIANAVIDVETYPDWVSNIKQAETLEVLSENEFVNYYVAGFPWPLKDRDVVFFTSLIKRSDVKSVFIQLEGRGSYIPEKKDIVRIKTARAYWSFIPEDAGKVRVSYRMLVDPGGNIPAWIINMFLVDGQYQNLSRLREILENNHK